jgi:hypothetical protein
MTHFRKSKGFVISLLCFSCLLISFTVLNFTVNAKENIPYYIKINKQQNTVTIYEKDKDGNYTVPIKAMTCSVGTATPLGVFKTPIKYRWKLLMGDVWGQYSTRIVNGILFHSVWYYKLDPSTLSTTQYNKLGTTASHGCVRLTVEDAKWIYDNCPIGTTVEIYNDKDPGPLGKPETIKLKAGTGWDPTDPSTKNPFKDITPKITGVKSKTIPWGTEIDLLKGLKATSTTGYDITSRIKVDGEVDIYTAGKYKITYQVNDQIGRSVEKTITIKVKENDLIPNLTGIRDRGITEDTVVDEEFALEGVTAYLGTKKIAKDEIEVTITEKSKGVYIIEYYIIAENGLSNSATATITVDKNAPVITGISHKELTLKQIESGKEGIKKLALEGIKVKDDITKIDLADIKISMKAIEDYGYLVTYKAKDEAGNITTQTVQFTYFEDVRIDGVTNVLNLPYGTNITKDYVKQGIKATDAKGNDITHLLTIKVSSYAGGEYKVTYSLHAESGQMITVVCYYFVNEEPVTEKADDKVSDSEEDTNSSEEDDDNSLGINNDNNQGNGNQDKNVDIQELEKSGVVTRSLSSDYGNFEMKVPEVLYYEIQDTIKDKDLNSQSNFYIRYYFNEETWLEARIITPNGDYDRSGNYIGGFLTEEGFLIEKYSNNKKGYITYFRFLETGFGKFEVYVNANDDEYEKYQEYIYDIVNSIVLK